MQYYFSLDGNTQQGPLDPDRLIEAGIRPDTMVWAEGMAQWTRADGVPELAGRFADRPVDRPSPPSNGPGQPPYAPPGGPVPLPPGGLMHPNYAQPPGSPGNPYGPPVGTNGYAIASLICGIVGLFGICCCPALLSSVLAVVFGHMARGQIKRGHGTGDGLAVAGLVMGYAGIVLSLLGVALSIGANGLNVNSHRFKIGF